ncbi:hypothetical protein BBD42_21560 [Paenibacillus sp. BIHB 4019]|uniref:Abortive infection protein-like C-terminal domain-containing protein n=1 Tax=Paenibacillus sp. BIHB 4019 TaxID=1870819 RepID=A0A1B2DM21_9BACL|nr:abortive infection family protein [Paenibacillus sp. BIHB 4019]ANY68764.1 hypothetical protein BBD42_21560 [Paenibacillus sp. BIHB 4019]
MDSLLLDVEQIKNILIARATNGPFDNLEYRDLRDKLIKTERIRTLLPRFIITCRGLTEFWGHITDVSPTYKGRKEYLAKQFESLLEYLEVDESSPADSIITDSLNGKLDATYIQEAWSKALERRETDPEGAITMARTLLESTCKFIMVKEEIKYEEKWEMPQLYKGVQSALNLAPDNHTEEIFKQILGGCSTVIHGLGSVRNKLGDAHGRKPKTIKPSKRHAQLTVNLAGAMADFLFATWEEKSEKHIK